MCGRICGCTLGEAAQGHDLMALCVFSAIELMAHRDPVPLCKGSHSGVGTQVGSRTEAGLVEASQSTKPFQPTKSLLVHIHRALLSVASWDVATSFTLTTGMLWLVYFVFVFECMNYYSGF